MQTRRIAAALGVVVTVLTVSAGQANADYPVPWGYPAGVLGQLTQYGQPPPGANDWSCRPTATHPNPVVLLHGFASTDTGSWQTVAPLLANEGYCVFTTTWGKGSIGDFGGVSTIEQGAAELAGLVDRVRTATGAAKVDVVGHSAAGALPFYAMRYLGAADKFGRLVALGSAFHGSDLSGLFSGPVVSALRRLGVDAPVTSFCGQCVQLTIGSPFLAVLDPDPGDFANVQFTNIVTRFDEIATPYDTGLLAGGPNVHNIVLQDRYPRNTDDHFTLLAEPDAVAELTAALR